MKALVVTAVAAMAMSALVASSASASIVAAKFSSSTFKLTTTGITVKRSGAEAKACTPSAQTEGFWDGASFWIGNQPGGETKLSCPSATNLTMVLYGQPKYDTVTGEYFLKVADFGTYSLTSPWGSYKQVTGSGSTGTWVNGSGATPSTLTFNEAWIGSTVSGSQKITISGTFNVTTTSGGLITLSH